MSDNFRIERDFVFGKRGFPLDVSVWAEHGDYPAHTHDFSEIAVVLAGTGIYRVGKTTLPFKSGDVFVTHGKRPHAYEQTRNLTLANVTYDPQLIAYEHLGCRSLPGYQALFVIEPALQKRDAMQRHLSLDGDSLLQVKHLCDSIRAELQEEEAGYQLAAVGFFLLLITHLSRLYQGRAKSPDARKVLQLGKALSHIETHYADALDLDELSRIAAMSRRSLYRAFEEVVHQSPLAYLQHIRLMKAVELLESTQDSVTGIAFDCGFNDSNYFSRIFRKQLGQSPSAYRKRSGQTR